ncbi:MAG TPA: NAD(P)/FAD-dependent oxidoreductase [Telluria sp.]|jgi:thioredoxin reductase
MHNFVTRDGTPPEQFRQIGRVQLAAYPNVVVQDARVESISGNRGAFEVVLDAGRVQARRILLCTGMVDEMLPIAGFREHWGQAIFQCPYCHAWEVQDRAWGYLANAADAHMLQHFAMLARGWTKDLTIFTGGQFELPETSRASLHKAGIKLETRPIQRLSSQDGRLNGVTLEDGALVPCEVLFAHPPQHQVPLVAALALALDGHGYVQVDPMTRESAVPGIYAAGDLTTRMQAAINAAASGMQAAAMINVELTNEMVMNGLL